MGGTAWNKATAGRTAAYTPLCKPAPTPSPMPAANAMPNPAAKRTKEKASVCRRCPVSARATSPRTVSAGEGRTTGG